MCAYCGGLGWRVRCLAQIPLDRVLEYEELDEPLPAQKEVRIQIRAVSVNQCIAMISF